MIKRASSGQRQQVLLWRINSPMFPTPGDVSSGQGWWKYPGTVPYPRSIEGYFCHSSSVAASGLSLLAVNGGHGSCDTL